MEQSGVDIPNTWLEVTVTTSEEAIEAVSEMLMNQGAGGVVVDDPRLLQRCAQRLGPDLVDEPDAALAWQHYVQGALPQVSAGPEVVQIRAYLPITEKAYNSDEMAVWVAGLSEVGLDPGPAQVTCRQVHEEDWANAWKQFFGIQRLGRQLVIVPSWLEYHPEPDDIVISLDPGMAFGTGTHPTTQLCLETLEDLVYAGCRVLDLGTGSGILAIAAAKLGATVTALDIDNRAAKVAEQNVAVNGVAESITVDAGTLASVPDTMRYDLVVANIVADTIIAILPDVPAHLTSTGRFVASGIIENRWEDVQAMWKRTGLVIQEVHQSGEWMCVVGSLA